MINPVKALKRLKAEKYLNKVDYSELIRVSDKIQTYHVDDEIELPGNIVGYFHHLPLNLTDSEKNEIHSLLSILREYEVSIQTVHFYNKNGSFNPHGNSFKHEVLPPWIAFPDFSPMSAAWRQGDGEVYMDVFISYLDSFSNEQYKAYFETYPIPEYMKVNSFGFNMMNWKARRE